MANAKTLTIIGGGTSGWMTAAYISRRCRGAVQVRLIDKEVSVNVGVGEALLLSFNDFMESMGYKMQEWFNYCECTLKAGIMFEGWGEDGKLIWHPFKFTYFAGLPLFDYWSRDQSQSLQDLQAQFRVTKNNRIETNDLDKYAIHADCGLLTKFFETTNPQVEHIKSDVTDVEWEGKNVKSITLKDGRCIESDIFVDCTGWKQVLGKHLTNIDTSDRLYLDTAVAGRIPYEDKQKEFYPYTNCEAVDHGWIWRIPTQSRLGSGLVFNRNITPIDEAKEYLSKYWNGRIKPDDMKVLRWDPFVCEEQWVGNVIAVGLSAGFIEPLESTGIALIVKAALNLYDAIYGGHWDQNDVRMFNAKMSYEHDLCVDFVNMHYSYCRKSSSPFWDYVKENYKKSEIQEWMESQVLDTEIMSFPEHKYGIFHGHNWNTWLYQLMPEIPAKTYDPMKFGVPQESIDKSVVEWKRELRKFYDESVDHYEYIKKGVREWHI